MIDSIKKEIAEWKAREKEIWNDKSDSASYCRGQIIYCRGQIMQLQEKLIAELENELALTKASAAGVSSLLLDVHQNCIALNRKLQEAKK